jgi:hypothetical protein
MVRWVCLGVLLLGVGCRKQSESEKGAGIVNDKLDLAKGAADALKARGNEVGRSAGQGVTETVKGIASGLRDSVMPPVDVTLDEPARAAGLSVAEAHAVTTEQRIEVTLRGGQPYRGGFSLAAFDEKGAELGRARAFEHRELSFSEPVACRFPFPADTRLSNARRYELRALAPKELSGRALKGITVSQLAVENGGAKVYAVFTRPFKGKLQLRAIGEGGELGRFESEPLVQAAESAGFISFPLDPSVDVLAIRRFEAWPLKP